MKRLHPVCAGKGAAPQTPGHDTVAWTGPLQCFREGHTRSHLLLGARWSPLAERAVECLWGQKTPGRRSFPALSFHVRKLPLDTARMSPGRSLIGPDRRQRKRQR